MSEDLRYNEEENGAVFSDEEMKKYSSLLRTAYPTPQTSIKNSVMAQIRAEKDGKVLKAADSTKNKTKHSKAKRLLVRYGSFGDSYTCRGKCSAAYNEKIRIDERYSLGVFT